MDWGVVVAAVVTAVGGIITTLLVVLRRENRDDHAKVMETILRIGGKVEHMDAKLDSHIEWHTKEDQGGKVLGRDKVGRKSSAGNSRKTARRSA